jgi:hypothetical protein
MDPDSGEVDLHPVLDENILVEKELTLPQSTETDITTERHGHFRLRYLYARAHETRTANPAEKGQDYITVRDNGSRLVFAVCDGVSGSFFGDIAAKYLGEHLIDWLWDVFPTIAGEEKQIQERLNEYLNLLTKSPDSLIQLPEVPADQPEMVKRVLEKKRNDAGSETTFSCGSIDISNPDRNTTPGKFFCAWMGNTEIQVFRLNKDDQPADLGASWDDKYRWSSNRGIVNGPPPIYLGTSDEVSHLVIFSDGFAPARSKLGNFPSDDDLRSEVASLDASSMSDDVAFLEISWGPQWRQIPESGLTRPAIRVCELSGNEVRAEWDPVTGAVAYKVTFGQEDNGVETVQEVSGESWTTIIEENIGKFSFYIQPVGANGVLGPTARRVMSVRERQTAPNVQADAAAEKKPNRLKKIFDRITRRSQDEK